MTRATLVFSLFTLAACGSATTDSADPAVGDSGRANDTDDTDDTDNTVTCDPLADGRYAARGSCFGMTMGVMLDMDDARCSFVLDDWSMNHGDLPDGGTVDGDQVTLSGPGFDGCAGTIDGDVVSGTCDDGCAWELSLD